MKYRLSFSKADRLIEKYYDGLTTGAEEKQLKEFLMQPGLPEQYQAEQAIFGYFDHKKEKKQISMRSYLRWAAVATVIVAVVYGTQLFVYKSQSNYAYIDGRKVSGMREVKLQAMASLGNISTSNDEVRESLKSINDDELVEQQLDVFSNPQK
jgi:hypothetical protein